MADWRIVTPTRAPRDDELNRPSGMAPGTGTVLTSSGNISIMFSQNKLGIIYQNVQPVVRYFYDFTTNEWQDDSYAPIDITTVDLTIPESAVSSATIKTSYFDLIAFEKGTTACKLAVANEAKTLIRNALIGKGVDVPDTTPFRQYAGMIGNIQSGGEIAFAFDGVTDDEGNASCTIPSNFSFSKILITSEFTSIGTNSYVIEPFLADSDGTAILIAISRFANRQVKVPFKFDPLTGEFSISVIDSSTPVSDIRITLYAVN